MKRIKVTRKVKAMLRKKLGQDWKRQLRAKELARELEKIRL